MLIYSAYLCTYIGKYPMHGELNNCSHMRYIYIYYGHGLRSTYILIGRYLPSQEVSVLPISTINGGKMLGDPDGIHDGVHYSLDRRKRREQEPPTSAVRIPVLGLLFLRRFTVGLCCAAGCRVRAFISLSRKSGWSIAGTDTHRRCR